MHLTLRPATSSDLPLLVDLYADMDGDSPLPVSVATEIFQQIDSLLEYTIYLVFQQQEPVATFSLLFVPTMMHRGFHKYAILDAFTVRSSHRRQGIGSEIMRRALQMSAQAGCYKLELSSNIKRDRAHEFYQSLGFKQHGWSFHLQLA
jgi:GNAT superfamily N-acetyltransferase